MPIKFKNPWGSLVSATGKPLDIQRSDLWAMDLAESRSATGIELYKTFNLIQVLQDYFEDFKAKAGNLPSLDLFPKSISFPEIRMNAEAVPVYSTPYNFPGHDEAVPIVRVVFRHPTSDLNTLSAIQYILSKWKDLCRSGRGTRFNTTDPEGDSQTDFQLSEGLNYRVPFKYDLTVRLYAGNNVQGANVLQMAPANVYILKGAWISGLQLSDLDYESNTPMTVSASLYVDNIVQDTGGNVYPFQGNFWSGNESYVKSSDPGIQPLPAITPTPVTPFRATTGGNIPPTPTIPEPPSIPANSLSGGLPMWPWLNWKRAKT